MDFMDIALNRQSCRNFDSSREVEREKLDAVINATRLSPSACNGQPYFLTVCTGETAKKVAKATQSMGMNKFSSKAPVMIVISEKPYSKLAAFGTKLKGNDYRSLDIGIATAYLTSQAHCEGLSTCILGWLDDKKIRELCSLDGTVRVVVALGYAMPDDKFRKKKRKDNEELVAYK